MGYYETKYGVRWPSGPGGRIKVAHSNLFFLKDLSLFIIPYTKKNYNALFFKIYENLTDSANVTNYEI